MKRVLIDEKVCEILQEHDRDGRADGHYVITDFIVALLEGRAETWSGPTGLLPSDDELSTFVG